MTALQQIRRIAEIEFAPLISTAQPLGSKLRLFIRDGSFVDIWVAERLPNRFGFHWERGHLDGTLFRYDNFPDTLWRNLETFPFHFHNGSQEKVESSMFPTDLLAGFRAFMTFLANHLERSQTSKP